ncbi:MAG: hypothetical protein IJM30_05840 [Thermoguttaceae bacterium]|nr:hypothetical protein [Thermoguttaceae bacterium]
MKTFVYTLSLLTIAATVCFATRVFADNGAVYNAENVVFTNGTVQTGRSGKPVFRDLFESADAWTTVDNYVNLLDVEFGKEFMGSKSLYIGRTKPIDDSMEYPNDTAWSIATDKRDLDGDFGGFEFVARLTAFSSKHIEGSSVGDGYRGSITWFDSQGEKLSVVAFPFYAERQTSQKSIVGLIPEGAASFSIKLGFDVPNIEMDEYVVLREVSLEVVDKEKGYLSPGSFVSGIFQGGDISWDVDAPEGTRVEFQAASAETLAGLNDAPFVGPDGSRESRYTQPFAISAPMVRYKAFLIPNGKATPTLRSVKVGDKVDEKWNGSADVDPPRVKLIGTYSKPSQERSGVLSFKISDASLIDANSLAFSLDDEDATSAFTREESEIGTLVYSWKLDKELSDGLHKTTVNANDAFGNSVLATRYFLVGSPASTPQVTLRDDGVALIDGEPFFPIGIYGVCERDFNGNDIDEAFRGLKEAGFNFAHSYSMPREDKFLRAAEKYGFKLWSVARFPDERFVEVERHSPAIIAWYLGDDTSFNTTPSELYDYFDSCKAVDPSRLTVQADPIDAGKEISNYRPYVAGTDAFLPEIYPVHGTEEGSGDACVAQTVQDVKRSFADARDANDGPKAIWPIIQYFEGWGWRRFPTYKELRGMSFGALAAGANGITWYTYGGFVDPSKNMYNYGATTTPERWKNISTVATQIRELTPVLLERTDPTAQPKATILSGSKLNRVGEESIAFLFKRREGSNYLLAVNTGAKDVDVQFEFSNEQDWSEAEVLFDEKEIAAPVFEKNAIREKIEGLGARVYKW